MKRVVLDLTDDAEAKAPLTLSQLPALRRANALYPIKLDLTTDETMDKTTDEKLLDEDSVVFVREEPPKARSQTLDTSLRAEWTDAGAPIDPEFTEQDYLDWLAEMDKRDEKKTKPVRRKLQFDESEDDSEGTSEEDSYIKDPPTPSEDPTYSDGEEEEEDEPKQQWFDLRAQRMQDANNRREAQQTDDAGRIASAVGNIGSVRGFIYNGNM